MAPCGTAAGRGRPPRRRRRRVLADPHGGPGHRLAAARIGAPGRTAPVGTSFRRWTQLLEGAAFTSDRAFHERPLPGADGPLGRRALTEADTVARERSRTVSVGAGDHGRAAGRDTRGIPRGRQRRPADRARRRPRPVAPRPRAGPDVRPHRTGRARPRGTVRGRTAGFEPELSRTVGWFTTLFPVVVDPGAAADLTAPAYLAAALKAVKDDLGRVPANGLSYGVLRHLSDAGLDAPAAPQVLFNYLGRFESGTSGDWQAAGTTGQLGEKRDPRMRLPRALEFNAIAEPAADGAYELVTTLSWPDGLFTDEDTATIGAYLREALTGLAALDHGGHSPGDFDLVPLTQADVDALDSPELRDILPLTPLQEGLYFHSVFDDDSAGSYVEQQLLTLEGEVDSRRAGVGRDPAAHPVPEPGRTVHGPRRRPRGLRAGERDGGALHHAGPARHRRRGDPRPRRAGPPRGIRPGHRPADAVHADQGGLRPERPRADRPPHHRRRLVGAADAPRPAGRVPRARSPLSARRLPRLRTPPRRARRRRERPGLGRTAGRSARPLAGRRGTHPLRPVRRHRRGTRGRHRRRGPDVACP